eukprot:g2857.t1
MLRAAATQGRLGDINLPEDEVGREKDHAAEEPEQAQNHDQQRGLESPHFHGEDHLLHEARMRQEHLDDNLDFLKGIVDEEHDAVAEDQEQESAPASKPSSLANWRKARRHLALDRDGTKTSRTISNEDAVLEKAQEAGERVKQSIRALVFGVHLKQLDMSSKVARNFKRAKTHERLSLASSLRELDAIPTPLSPVGEPRTPALVAPANNLTVTVDPPAPLLEGGEDLAGLVENGAADHEELQHEQEHTIPSARSNSSGTGGEGRGSGGTTEAAVPLPPARNYDYRGEQLAGRGGNSNRRNKSYFRDLPLFAQQPKIAWPQPGRVFARYQIPFEVQQPSPSIPRGHRGHDLRKDGVASPSSLRTRPRTTPSERVEDILGGASLIKKNYDNMLGFNALKDNIAIGEASSSPLCVCEEHKAVVGTLDASRSPFVPPTRDGARRHAHGRSWRSKDGSLIQPKRALLELDKQQEDVDDVEAPAEDIIEGRGLCGFRRLADRAVAGVGVPVPLPPPAPAMTHSKPPDDALQPPEVLTDEPPALSPTEKVIHVLRSAKEGVLSALESLVSPATSKSTEIPASLFDVQFDAEDENGPPKDQEERRRRTKKQPRSVVEDLSTRPVFKVRTASGGGALFGGSSNNRAGKGFSRSAEVAEAEESPLSVALADYVENLRQVQRRYVESKLQRKKSDAHEAKIGKLVMAAAARTSSGRTEVPSAAEIVRANAAAAESARAEARRAQLEAERARMEADRARRELADRRRLVEEVDDEAGRVLELLREIKKQQAEVEVEQKIWNRHGISGGGRASGRVRRIVKSVKIERRGSE